MNTKNTILSNLIRFCLENKLVVSLLVAFFIVWGMLVAPFDWDLAGLPRNPVPVDAIPDIGENQQIVFTEWAGRSPQDVEDQITYPLTVSLLGIPGVKTVRCFSMFGISIIYIIFKEDIEFYWSRSRLLEKLNSLPADTLPQSVQPTLGPDATPLGQIFWYTLEGRDENENPTGGWDLQELRTIQDWYIRYSLSSVDGVSEVASIGGFVKEYQVDVDPNGMWANGINLDQIIKAVQMSNIDVGARTIEINKVEYVIRGLGFIKKKDDIEKIVLDARDNVPITVKDVANVTLGPALRRGALDKEGAEVVGGVVVARYGDNPLEVIQNVKKRIEEISPGLPQKILPDGTISKVTIVPFYDRTGLIYETLGTLNSALTDEILITIIVVLLMVMHFRSAILISGLMPLAVLMCFIGMKLLKVDANIVALSGIAIAIGTIVDMGIIICENILKHMKEAKPEQSILDVIHKASSEVGGAVLTALTTTIISFLPVFTMVAAEGKLFKPLAYTKTLALIASGIIAITVIPPFAHILFKKYKPHKTFIRLFYFMLLLFGIIILFSQSWWIGLIVISASIYNFYKSRLSPGIRDFSRRFSYYILAFVISIFLTKHWLPLGPSHGTFKNLIFVIGIIMSIFGAFYLIRKFYEQSLEWFLKHKAIFLTIFLFILLFAATTWLGFDRFFGFIPNSLGKIGLDPYSLRTSGLWSAMHHKFPGLGKEFMPPLDEGSFLYMPTTMPHASIGEALDVLQKQDIAISTLPEIESVVGKIGRVDSPLDPAPISMIETIINYKSEYITDKDGNILKFKYNSENKQYERDEKDNLIPDNKGRPYRQWRDQIKNPDDIWNEIVKAAQIPGTTSAPKLQPIAARIVMLQSGMRAPMGIKVKGPDLKTIEKVSFQLEKLLKEIPSIEPSSVIADRIVGKPYLEIEIDRERISKYGVHIKNVQDTIEVAIGGKKLTTTVEGRERYNVRIRYQRELRDTIEALGKILVPVSGGGQIPLIQLSDIKYSKGPQVIKSENTFLVGYVLFDMKPGKSEVDVVEDAREYLDQKIKEGEIHIPEGISYTFAGSFENQIRSAKTLSIVLPLALFIIFIILYFQFRSVITSILIFTGIFIAWSGGFILLWLYAQPWFLNFSIFSVNLQDLFQIKQFNLSVAVWVGFLALFGIATDNGVILATYLNQSFASRKPSTIHEIRKATIFAANRRLRPCLMTAATTILALIPILSSKGRGSDVMVPMAIPSFGGMILVIFTVYVVPVLYCSVKEIDLKWKARSK